MSISLCMIVKDEESNLPRCLNSVRNFIDEMIIVDTGSVDDTVKIAKQFGAKIYHHRWNDSFAQARNYSLQKATKEWILIMDADDEFEQQDQEELLRVTENNIDGPNVYCGRTLCYSGDRPDNNTVLINLNVRLIRNHRDYQFEGRIHEQLVLKPEDISSPCTIANIRFRHYGYLTSYISQKDKHKRNITLIQKELDEDSLNSFMLFNMGNEYFAMQEFKKSLDFYMLSFRNAEFSQSYCPALFVRIIMCYEALHMDTELFKYIKLGLQYYPNQTDFEFLKASALLGQKKTEAAIRSYKKCIKMGDSDTDVNSILGVGTFKPHYALSSIYSKLGDYDKAVYHCVKAIKFNTTFQIAYSELIDLLEGKGKPAKSIKNRLVKLIPYDVNSYLMLSDLFYARKAYSEAYDLAVLAENIAPEDALIDYYEGMCQFYLGNYKQAHAHLQEIYCDTLQSKSAFIRLLCTYFDEEINCSVLESFQTEIDSTYYKVAMDYRAIITGKNSELFADNEDESSLYLKPIIDLLEMLLKVARFDDFKKSLALLNFVRDREVFLLLGKMYYRNGYVRLAYNELKKSIQLTDLIDAEGLEIMKSSFIAASACTMTIK